MTGFHEAIWERIPEEWRLAACKCKCKERLVDNIYKSMCAYVRKKCIENKKWGSKTILEYKRTFLKEQFNSRIIPFCWAFDWYKSPEGGEYWEGVNKWINYYIENNK